MQGICELICSLGRLEKQRPPQTIAEPPSPQSLQSSVLDQQDGNPIQRTQISDRRSSIEFDIQPWPVHEKQIRNQKRSFAPSETSDSTQYTQEPFQSASEFYRSKCLPTEDVGFLLHEKLSMTGKPAYAERRDKQPPSPSSQSIISIAEEIPSMHLRDLQRKPVYRKKALLPYSEAGFSLLGLPDSAGTVPIQQRLQKLSSAIKSVSAKSRSVAVKIESPPSQPFPPAGPIPWSGWKNKVKLEEKENSMYSTRKGNTVAIKDHQTMFTSQSTRKGLPKFKREDIDYGLAEVLASSGTPLSLK